jgi:hypothetical protein
VGYLEYSLSSAWIDFVVISVASLRFLVNDFRFNDINLANPDDDDDDENPLATTDYVATAAAAPDDDTS